MHEALTLVWTFFKVGIIAFGGGWSTVGIIKNAVVPTWINESDFRALIAIAQSTPGPIALNTATMIGWSHGGFISAILSTLSVVAFPLMAITATTLLAGKVKLKQAALDSSLKTGSLAMMLMTLWVLKPVSLDPLLLVLMLGAFYISAFTKINALWAILGSGAINAIAGPWIRGLFGG